MNPPPKKMGLQTSICYSTCTCSTEKDPSILWWLSHSYITTEKTYAVGRIYLKDVRLQFVLPKNSQVGSKKCNKLENTFQTFPSCSRFDLWCPMFSIKWLYLFLCLILNCCRTFSALYL